MCERCVARPGWEVGRRLFLAGGLAAGAASFAPARARAAAEQAPTLAPDEALRRIMEGNARYAANTMQRQDFSAGRAARASAQYPIAGILSCADSRVAPELAFDQGPGDLFVVRVAGNFVNPEGLASMEYGVKFLGVRLLMVLGHTNCGAVDATIKTMADHSKLPGHLPDLVRAIRPAVEAAQKRKPESLLEAAIAENVRQNARRLAGSGPIIAGMVRGGKVKVVGGVYDLATGKVTLT